MSKKMKGKKSTREKKKSARDAAVNEIKKARKKQGKKKKKISRRQIERAIIAETGLSQEEVNDAIAETYDDMTELGLLTPREFEDDRSKKKKKKKVSRNAG